MAMTFEQERDAAIKEVQDAFLANKKAVADFSEASKLVELAVKNSRVAADRLSKAKGALEFLVMRAAEQPAPPSIVDCFSNPEAP
jgi:hypothetical protein